MHIMNNKCPFIIHCSNGKKDMTCHFSPTVTVWNVLLNMLRIQWDRWYFTHPYFDILQNAEYIKKKCSDQITKEIQNLMITFIESDVYSK